MLDPIHVSNPQDTWADILNRARRSQTQAMELRMSASPGSFPLHLSPVPTGFSFSNWRWQLPKSLSYWKGRSIPTTPACSSAVPNWMCTLIFLNLRKQSSNFLLRDNFISNAKQAQELNSKTKKNSWAWRRRHSLLSALIAESPETAG